MSPGPAVNMGNKHLEKVEVVPRPTMEEKRQPVVSSTVSSHNPAAKLTLPAKNSSSPKPQPDPAEDEDNEYDSDDASKTDYSFFFFPQYFYFIFSF